MAVRKRTSGRRRAKTAMQWAAGGPERSSCCVHGTRRPPGMSGDVKTLRLMRHLGRYRRGIAMQRGGVTSSSGSGGWGEGR